MDEVTAPGERPRRSTGSVVMDDVARAAGVSPKTVSRVVNGSPQVRPEVRDRVLDAVERLGYRRNAAARALAAGRTHVLGIVSVEAALHGVAQHVLGAERAARERGYGTVVVTVPEDADDDAARDAVERAVALGAEGVVLGEPLREVGALAGVPDVPLVTAAAVEPVSPRHRSVSAAEEAGAREAVEHLLARGHRTVAHVSGPPASRPARLREAGWRAALEVAGAPVGEPARGDWAARSGWEAARELLARPGERPTALFAGNDSMAIGAVKAFLEAGLRVPEDVAVVGFDDLPESEFLPVPLSSVRQDVTGVARRAVELLVALVEGGAPPQRAETVPAHLVVRASSGPPRRGGGASP
ncbi:LacI family DNA-binding transcriptional regulator [Kineococcus terrestris]|uniref:LacI family DNA-binding transcriptional regulator n=1 Tax=Kineococcus terrestris TaxID=2044856 RepID=UPI0034DB20DB